MKSKLVWALVARWTANAVLLPSPLVVFDAFVELARTLELFEHTAISFGRMLVSVAIASVIALPLGLLMGLSRALDAIVDPTIEVLRPISGIAWIPLALFIFGIGNALPVFIMTYTAFFPILLGTVAGVRGVDRRLIDAARTIRNEDGRLHASGAARRRSRPVARGHAARTGRSLSPSASDGSSSATTPAGLPTLWTASGRSTRRAHGSCSGCGSPASRR